MHGKLQNIMAVRKILVYQDGSFIKASSTTKTKKG
jgi:hypothetical protein